MVEGPVLKRKISRRMKRNVVYGIAIFILLAAAGIVLFNQDSGDESADTASAADAGELNALARPYADEISNYFNVISGQLSEYANSESVKALFQSGTEQDLAQQGEASRAQFDSALKVRLLKPGEYSADSASTPPLSFGSIAMLNKIERSSGPVAAEVLLFGSENQHIVIVERVKNQSDQLIGLVHLSIAVSLFGNALENVNPADGYLEIQQAASGTPLVLNSIGDSSLKSGAPGTASISGTLWTVAYWPPLTSISSQITSVGGGVSPFFMFLAGLVLFSILGVGYLVKKRRPVFMVGTGENEIEYRGAIRAIMDGAHPGMEKLIKHFPGITGSSEAQAQASEALEGEDITSIASMDSLNTQDQEADIFDITQPPESEEGPDPPQEKNTETSQSSAASESSNEVPAVIFRKYDIRGKVKNDLTAEIVKQIGLAIGTQAESLEKKTIIVGRDGRNSSPELAKSLIEGLTSAGKDVIDIGIVPTPILYFATHHFETGNGVMITGSHNGPEYNGLKIVLGGNTLSEDKILELRDVINKGEYSSGNGNVRTEDVVSDYLMRITDDIPVAFGSSFKLVVDCGNGAASVVASQLYKAMGHDVVDLYCELDGNFPNHHPDPSQPENLKDLINKIQETGADLGFAFDGDGDRLGVVDSNGNILWPDRQMMVFARDVLSRNQGAEIIFDVKCSKQLKTIIESSGGKPLMWKTGHSLIKSKMKEINAPLAGEMSGHIFFSERWYGFDDALYSGARMLEILTNAKVKPAEFFAELPSAESTPELRIDLPESEHEKFMSELEDKIAFDDAEIITVDGFRVEFSDGWGLIRPSNTTPCLVARFEADTPEALKTIQDKFKELIASVNPELSVPF